MKRLIFTLILLSIVLISGCGESDKEREKRKKREQAVLNRQKFYYPIPYDDYWRSYNANLIGAQGWINEKCDVIRISGEVIDTEKRLNKYRGLPVIILSDHSTHFRWGTYKGTFVVKDIEKGTIIEVNYRDFKPDFSKGEWLSKEYH